METINSITATAAKVIWGENNNENNDTAPTEANPTSTDSTTMNNETRGQEPISGKQGDVSKGEPFDAGNIEPASAETTEPVAANASTTDAAAASTTAGETKGPTTEHPSTTGDIGFKAVQADVRDPDTNLTTDPKTEAERKNVDDTGSLDKSENPAKVEGAGPKPIEEVARERGGDAGDDSVSTAKSADPGTADAPETAGEDKDEGQNKGTGEQYVKSSGLQADGGDFDATKPGAGREADRLMEEKGIANPAAAATHKPETDATPEQGHGEGEKKSLKDKIKAKLHKN